MKTLIATTLLASTLLLTGCFNTDAPKCSDKEVTDLVKNIYSDWVNNAEQSQNPMLAMFLNNLPKNITDISSARATSYDKEIKLRTCKADITFDNNATTSLMYTVQITEEDSENFYVELNSDSLEGIMQQSMMSNIYNNMGN
jgi:hypothetical protein